MVKALIWQLQAAIHPHAGGRCHTEVVYKIIGAIQAIQIWYKSLIERPHFPLLSAEITYNLAIILTYTYFKYVLNVSLELKITSSSLTLSCVLITIPPHIGRSFPTKVKVKVKLELSEFSPDCYGQSVVSRQDAILSLPYSLPYHYAGSSRGKQMNQYLSMLNSPPCVLAYCLLLVYNLISIWMFSSSMQPVTSKETLLIQVESLVSPLSSIRSVLQQIQRIRDRGNPYRIPMVVRNQGLVQSKSTSSI